MDLQTFFYCGIQMLCINMNIVTDLTDLSQWLQTLGSSRLSEEVIQGRKQKATVNKTVL